MTPLALSGGLQCTSIPYGLLLSMVMFLGGDPGTKLCSNNNSDEINQFIESTSTCSIRYVTFDYHLQVLSAGDIHVG